MSGIPASMRRLTEDELLAVAGGGSSGVNVNQNTVNGIQTTTVNGNTVTNGTYTFPFLGLPPGATVTIGTGTVSVVQINSA
jgi:hypothetical protein